MERQYETSCLAFLNKNQIPEVKLRNGKLPIAHCFQLFRMPCTSFVSSRLQTSKFCCPFYLLLIKIDQPNLQLMLSNTLALKSIFAIYNAQCSDDWISSRGNRKRHCRIGFYIQISSITLQHDDFTTVLSSYVLVWYFSVRGTSLRLMRPV